MTLNLEFSTEKTFRRAWSETCGTLPGDGVELALAGGTIADRLAWIFMSGYQAAVRSCFPEFSPGSGWTCFAAAEAGQGAGCELREVADGFQLSGEKSWIAGAGVIGELVVAVGEGEARRFVRVGRNEDGVSISLPRTPGFLSEMSQGVAGFDGVFVATQDVIAEPARALWFKGAEPLFFILALNACLMAHPEADEDREVVTAATAAIRFGRTLAGALDDKQVIVPGLKQLRALTLETLSCAENVIQRHPTLSSSWQADGQLLKMFGLTEVAGS